MKSTVAVLAKKFYEEHLKEILEPDHTGEFISIEPKSKQYFLGKTEVEAMKKGKEAVPGKRKLLLRVGYDAVYKIGGTITIISNTSSRIASRNEGRE